MCEAESYGQSGVGGRVVEVVGHKGVGHVVLEESLCAQTLAKVVVGSEVDVDFVLTGRYLVVVFIDTAKHGDVSAESDVELEDQVVVHCLALAWAS